MQKSTEVTEDLDQITDKYLAGDLELEEYLEIRDRLSTDYDQFSTLLADALRLEERAGDGQNRIHARLRRLFHAV